MFLIFKQDWTDVTNLSIKRSSTNPSVKIDFYAKEHGDGYPFDGKGRVLAHAFFPPYGQLHFDDDESWSSVSFGGLCDLFDIKIIYTQAMKRNVMDNKTRAVI